VNGKHQEAPLAPATWLARAREQSQELAQLRAGQTRQFRGVVAAAPRGGRGSAARRRMAWAGAALVISALLGSGAWALVVRLHRTRPASQVPLPPRTARPAPQKPYITTAPILPPPATKHRDVGPQPAPRSAAKAAPPTAPKPVHEIERGDDEIIVVTPHERLPPLFSPEEWKRQH
jgi:hypothetical protein